MGLTHSVLIRAHRPFDQGDITPEDPGLHGGHGVLADGGVLPRRALDGHPGQAWAAAWCRASIDRLMPGAMAQPSMPPSEAITSKVVAVPESMMIQVARIDHMGADGVDQAVGRRLPTVFSMRTSMPRSTFSPITRGSTFRVAAGRGLRRFEDRLRHDAGDDAAVEDPKLQDPSWPAAGRARPAYSSARAAGMGGRAPLGDPALAVMHGERGCWCCPVRWPAASGVSEEHVAGRLCAPERRRPAEASGRRRRPCPRRTPDSVRLGRPRPRSVRPGHGRAASSPGRWARNPWVAQRAAPGLEP